MSEKDEDKLDINKKGAVLGVLQILKEESDEEHYLTYNQISAKLKEKYNIIRARKAIADDIKVLNAFGITIDKGENDIGFAYINRDLDSTQVRYIIDSIYSSRSITQKRAAEISKTLSSMLSKYQSESFSSMKKTVSSGPTSKDDVFYNIYTIQEAIKQKRQIQFRYLEINKQGEVSKRMNGYYYKVNPYYMVNNFGRYYLIANKENHQNASNYRIDYMMDIEVIPASHCKDIWEIPQLSKVTINQYLAEHIYLFGGDVVDCHMQILNYRVLTDVKDWFGENAKISYDAETDKTYCDVRCDENALFYWARQYGEKVEILSPESLRERLYKELSAEMLRYQPTNKEEEQ